MRILFLLLSLSFIFSSPTTLKIARIQDATTLDPAVERTLYSAEVISNMFEGLIKVETPGFKVKPLLAEKWKKSPDGKIWKFYLRRGIKFHDGSELNADAVVFSLTRFKRKNFIRFSSFFKYLEQIRKLDNYTVEFKLSKPDSVFLLYLSMPGAFIVSTNSEKRGKFKPIGTGPFMLSKWERGKFILLKSNQNYWQGKPKINKIMFIVIPNTEWRLLQLKNGNASVLRLFSLREYNELKHNPFIKILFTPNIIMSYIGFNTSRPPFNDRRVREAFAHLISKKRLVQLLLSEHATPAISIVPSIIPGSNPNLKEYEYNPKKASKLLTEAGYTDGFSCTLYSVQGRGDLKEFLLRIKKNAEVFGIKITLKFLTFSELFKVFTRGEHDLFALGWTIDIPDASSPLESLLYSKGKNNYSFYNNPKLDKLIEKARTVLDEKEREKLYMEAQQIIHDDVAILPLFYFPIAIAHNKAVRGIKVNFRGQLLLKNVSIESLITQ